MRVSRHISPQRVELPPATAKGDLSWKLCATNKLGWKFEGDFLAYNLDAPEYIPTGRVTAKRIQYRAPRVVWIRHEYFEREYDDRAIIL